MCLTTVDIGSLDPRASGTGWKVFEWKSGHLHPEIMGRDPYEIGEWYEAYDLDRLAGPGYPPGFHIFTTEADARHWKNPEPNAVVRPVYWRHRLAAGSQHHGDHYLRIVVAKEIKIPRLRRCDCRPA